MIKKRDKPNHPNNLPFSNKVKSKFVSKEEKLFALKR